MQNIFLMLFFLTTCSNFQQINIFQSCMWHYLALNCQTFQSHLLKYIPFIGVALMEYKLDIAAGELKISSFHLFALVIGLTIIIGQNVPQFSVLFVPLGADKNFHHFGDLVLMES